MKKYFRILCFLVWILTLTACGTDFNGSRMGNDSEFVMDYKILNTTDSQNLVAAEGNIIHAEIIVESGSLSYKIQKEDGAPVYEGKDVSVSDEFDIEIEQGGTYTVTVTGKRAKGSVSFIVEGNQDKDAANENNEPDNKEMPSQKTDMYDHILAEYRDMVQNDFYRDLRDSDMYDSSFGEYIGLEIRTHKQDIYYTFYDIDGNGTMELMIAGGENSVSDPVFTPWNYDLYGYDGNHAVSVFPEMEFGYRTNFSLYENGIIEVFYSSSAAESGIDFYRIGSDGFTPELVDSFAAVGHLEGEEPVFVYSQNGKEITEEEYRAKIQSYEVTLTAELDWRKI